MKIERCCDVLRAICLAATLIAVSAPAASLASDAPDTKSADAQPTKEQALLLRGRQALEQGDPQRAITEFFDPVIQHYESSYKESGSKIYSAQNMRQTILYTALPNDHRNVEVLDSSWADAYLMKGYALIELHQVEDAKSALEKAIVLSPMNSQYLSELAYVFQAQGNCEKSIATYAQAGSMAELGSEDETKISDLTRALRGQGYCLVEQGKLHEAEAMYRKSLALDPNDTKAMGELEYIRKIRKK